MLDFILQYWIQILFGILISAYSYFFKMIKNYKKKLDATNEGIIVILKMKIVEQYNVYKTREFITIEEKETIKDLFNVYKKFECCDVIQDLMTRLDSIPIK